MYKNELEKIKRTFYSYATGLRNEGTYYIYKTENEYGVAVDNINNIKIDEQFSNVRIKNISLKNKDKEYSLITLMSDLTTHKSEFAAFCMQFIDDDNIAIVQETPLKWWKKWKELIGNKLHNPRPYDIIAELYTIYLLKTKNIKGINWTGPVGSSIDVTTDDIFYEVKSSLIRYENEITISSQYQLNLEEKITNLIFFKMEKMDQGVSINDLIDKISKLDIELVDFIEEKLEKKGYRKHRSIRNDKYVIHEIREYQVNDDFPRITEKSFINGKYPKNVKKITYTINLDNLDYEIWER